MSVRSIVLAIVIGLTWTGSAQAGVIVYDNLLSALGNYLGGFPYEEVADDFTLGLGPRELESLSVAYAGFRFDGDETLTVKLYKMDGPPTPGSFGFNTPGTVLFSATEKIMATLGTTLTFHANAGIVLPETVAIGLSFAGVEFDPNGPGADAGPLLFDPPAVGSSLDDYWLRGLNPGDPWGLFTFGGSPPINLGVQIAATAVPEPATIGLLALGVAAVVRRRTLAQR